MGSVGSFNGFVCGIRPAECTESMGLVAPHRLLHRDALVLQDPS